ncbi:MULTISPECIES: hypothetical protein [Nonomuraea]|uniref:Uncharacterized protein n=1 Tax=Nonomuraea mangrovi TaxID=2316207 RepID=A0ABW4TC47_9ACTN
MTKIRNVLAAGAMGASVLIAPVTMPAQFASAETVTGTPSTTSLTSVNGPCDDKPNPDKCRARLGDNHGDGGGGY